MPDTKLSALPELAVAPAAGDQLYIQDVSEVAASQSKRLTVANLFTSPTLVTPALGTPASGVMTNVTGLPTAGLLDDAVTYAKMQNVSATDRLLGRDTVGAGDIEEITPAAARTMLDVPSNAEAILDTIVDAKGDLIVGTAADTVARLAVGTNDQVLTADSAQASGVKWATGNADIRVRAYNSANISIANNTETALTLNSERWDTDAMHSTVSNTSRLTATTAGLYVIAASVRFAGNGTGYRQIRIRLNGVDNVAITFVPNNSTTAVGLTITTLYNLAATDYVELMAFQNSGAALDMEAILNESPEFAMVKVLG